MTDKPLTLSEVAARFGKSYDWMQRNAKKLRATHGFPAPIPGFGQVYDPLAIEQWLARQRDPAPKSDVTEPELTDDYWATTLDERALTLARPHGRA